MAEVVNEMKIRVVGIFSLPKFEEYLSNSWFNLKVDLIRLVNVDGNLSTRIIFENLIDEIPTF